MSAALVVALLLAIPAQEAVETEIQQLVPPAGSGSSFGRALAVQGDLAVIGSNEDVGTNPLQGMVHVYRWDGAAWVEEPPVLTASDGEAFDAFGDALALDGDVLVVGVPDDDIGGHINQGSVRVYRRTASGWSEEATLLAADGAKKDAFGRSVDVSGDVVVVGAPYDDLGPGGLLTGDEGSAHVFRWKDGAWIEEQALLAGDGAEHDHFGARVAVHRDVVVVAAPDDDQPDGGKGSVHVYRWDGLAWALDQVLVADYLQYGFGKGLDVRNDLVAVGAPDLFDGSVSLYRWDGAVWPLEQTLEPVDSQAIQFFGDHVSLATDLVTAGAPFHTAGIWFAAGAAVSWRFDGSTWTDETLLLASDPDTEEKFGKVALAGELLLLGSDVDADPPREVLSFDLLPDGWSWKGHALAGARGLPVLTGSGTAAAGEPVTVSLLDAAPTAPTVLVVGLATADQGFKGGILVPVPDVVLPGYVTSFDGRLVLAVHWPAGVAPGQSVVTQAWIVDVGGPQGYAASNGLAVVSH